MEVYVDTLCLLAHPKEGQQQFKNKKQPELTENRTVWKPDNQGDKEETLTQTGSQGTEDSQQGGGWRMLRGGGLWKGAGSATASRPHSPTLTCIDKPGGTAG